MVDREVMISRLSGCMSLSVLGLSILPVGFMVVSPMSLWLELRRVARLSSALIWRVWMPWSEKEKKPFPGA